MQDTTIADAAATSVDGAVREISTAFSATKAFVVPTDEEVEIATQTARVTGVLAEDVAKEPAGVSAGLAPPPRRVLGVIGPTRLNYARVIPTVDYAARIVSQLIGK